MGSAWTYSMWWQIPDQVRVALVRWATPLVMVSVAERPTMDSRSIWLGDRAMTVIEKGFETPS